MKVLVVGLGSIAQKHIGSLKQLLPDCDIWALRSRRDGHSVAGVNNIYSWGDLPGQPDFTIISNPTSLHRNAIEKALYFNCPLFIEKPVLIHPSEAASLLPAVTKVPSYIACNLRFHPCIVFLKKYLSEQTFKVNEVNAYCGSDLSKWRSNVDYRTIYSAKAALGGGVHLDLIHEIDYCCWLFGFPITSFSVKRKISHLEIDSTDFAAYHLNYDAFTVNIVLNYYRKKAKRTLEIVTGEGTIYIDLLRCVVSFEDEPIFNAAFQMEDTYLLQMKYFVDHLHLKLPMMNSFSESTEVLKIAVI